MNRTFVRPVVLALLGVAASGATALASTSLTSAVSESLSARGKGGKTIRFVDKRFTWAGQTGGACKLSGSLTLSSPGRGFFAGTLVTSNHRGGEWKETIELRDSVGRAVVKFGPWSVLVLPGDKPTTWSESASFDPPLYDRLAKAESTGSC